MHRILKKTKTILSTALLTTIAAGLAACVTAPYNDQWVDPFAVNFNGYAENPGATVEIEAFDTQTNTWVTIQSSTATSTPTNYGGETLYQWSETGVDTSPSGQCIWGAGPSCVIPTGSASAKFRVHEVGGRRYTTFDEGGTTCVINQVAAGTNWFTAGVNCASPETAVLTLRAFT